MANINIREAQSENIEKYLSVFNATKHNAYISHGEVFYGRATQDLKWVENIDNEMRQEFRNYINNGAFLMFEILLSEELAGFVILEVNKKVKVAVLQDIMIIPDNQGKGLGTEVLALIEKYLVNHGITMIILESGLNNKKAHDFFENNGYTKISVEYGKIISNNSSTK